MAFGRCVSLTFTPKRALTYTCLAKIREYVSAVNTQRQIKCRFVHTTKTSVLSIITSKRLVHTTSHHGSSSPSNPGVPDISYAGNSPQDVDKLEQKVSHTPVMVSEVIDILQPKNGKLFIDMTFGAGGHTKAILRENPKAQVVCLDRDPLAYNHAKELAKNYDPQQVLPCLGKFSELPDILCNHGISLGSVDGILFDVGASSMQFNSHERGFSLSSDGPLDMRMDQGRDPDGVSAQDVVNHLPAPDLRDIIKTYGEDRMANKIAHTIVNARNVFGKITTTKELADIVETAFDGYIQKDKLGRYSHPATRTFQALRIFVNNELNEINNGLEAAYHYLRPGGVCVGISFQSLEDRIFKRHFHGIDVDEAKNKTARQQFRSVKDHHEKYSKDLIQGILKKKWIPVDKKAKTPSDAEIAENPRSRSAKLRAATKSSEF